jgi:hypothetical protein
MKLVILGLMAALAAPACLPADLSLIDLPVPRRTVAPA